uniref:PGG domain-containing protein n=2 Tax=Chenopodium quinoa TaxID=63459 RepID=A0A803MI82_CHEQI
NLTNKGGEQREHNNVSLKGFLGKFSELTKSLVYMRDFEGYTPVLRAVKCGRLGMARFLIKQYPQSVGIPDYKGRTILHHMGAQAADLVDDLKDIMPKELQPLVNRSRVKERELIKEMMDDELYIAAKKGELGDVGKRPPRDDEWFCRRTPGGSNIIHVVLRHANGNDKATAFVTTALSKWPILSMRQDNNGDTPLHLAAKWKTGVPMKLLVDASKKFLKQLDESEKAFHVAPWAVKNNKGSFPIHEALQADNLDGALDLLECDEEAAHRVDDLGETPLHAFAKYGFSIEKDEAKKFVKKLKGLSKDAAYLRDDEGLTPLLSAAKSGRFQVVQAILEYCPQSAYLRDSGGRTFLHLLRFTGEDVDESLANTFKNAGDQLFDIPEADTQRLVQDYEGSTPLHHAIRTGNSIAAIVLTQKCLKDEEQRELALVDKKGDTIPDLLASHDVPNEIITKIRKKVPKAVSLARSSYGIRKTEMKESANALSVVAALLATITFAAAFQVPGGFDGDDGSPVLLRKPAFIIFVITNTIAMCCSMLCLFLLLWVMGIGKMHGSLVVLDLCIHLLRASFYLTLLTFTMGVFVVTAKKSLWLAILVCGLCFVAFVLTFRRSINFLAKCINLTPEIKKNAKSIGEDSEKSPAIGNSAASDGIHVEINQFNTVVDLH